jgi:hypothetical protein
LILLFAPATGINRAPGVLFRVSGGDGFYRCFATGHDGFRFGAPSGQPGAMRLTLFAVSADEQVHLEPGERFQVGVLDPADRHDRRAASS